MKPLNASTKLNFSTKSQTLADVSPHLKHARVLDQISFTAREWSDDPESILKRIRDRGWERTPLIVRSSALTEDQAAGSQAGRFKSIGEVTGGEAVKSAVERVIESFNTPARGSENQVFIQVFLSQVRVSGVMFTRDPSNAGYYYVLNYDESSRRTDSVTGGRDSNGLRAYYLHRRAQTLLPAWIRQVKQLAEELEILFGSDSLDIEFAITQENILYLLQVRPLKLARSATMSVEEQTKFLELISAKIETAVRPHPYLHGEHGIFGIMPDWNPAEIIGIRPRALAFSLYKEVITDSIWAYQRDNYGYKSLRSFPLLFSFGGIPYVDVRVSFNSFIPAQVEDKLSAKLVNHYVRKLLKSPWFHDKVEFEIVYSCYALDLPQRLESLLDEGFTKQECDSLTECLRALTNRIILPTGGLWKQDLARIKKLSERHATLANTDLDEVSRIYWLLEDCKRFGTLPFAGLARAAFMAVQMLRSLQSVGIFASAEYSNFLSSLNTISSQMGRDFNRLSRNEFLSHYGHLRPGTYDILCPRYDEDPDRYFSWHGKTSPRAESSGAPFALSLAQLQQLEQALKAHRLETDPIGLLTFLKEAIEGREFAKFVFTKNLSDALDTLCRLGSKFGISREDLAHVDIRAIYDLYSSSRDIRDKLVQNIMENKACYEKTEGVLLPPVIWSPEQVWAFEKLPCEPNFITLGKAIGHTATLSHDRAKLKGSILFIPSADPGFDWIFTCGIAGFVTMFGGVNSHMAIRAAELGLPAIIGAGEEAFERWSMASTIEIDAGNRQVRVLR